MQEKKKHMTTIKVLALSIVISFLPIFLFAVLDQAQLNSQLITAADGGMTSKVKEMLRQGANVHAGNDLALRKAAKSGHVDILRLLLTELPEGQRADFNVLLMDSESGYASWYSYLPVVEFLRTGLPEDQRANMHKFGNIALAGAAAWGNKEVVRFLLTGLPEGERADVHADDDEALKTAAAHNRWYIVAYLLQYGADRAALTAEQIKEFYNSSRAQEYIADELLPRMLDHKDWHGVERLLTMIPASELQQYIQTRIGCLIAPAIAEQIVAMHLSLSRQPLHIQDKILSYIFGPTTIYYYHYYRSLDEQQRRWTEPIGNCDF